MRSARQDLEELLCAFGTADATDDWIDDDQSWFDYGFDEGCRILGRFQEPDWDQLTGWAATASNTRIHFLAQWLDASPDPRATQVLCLLLPVSTGSAWFMCAQALGHRLTACQAALEALEAHALQLRTPRVMESCERGVIRFVNIPMTGGERFADYLRRYDHLLSQEVRSLVAFVRMTDAPNPSAVQASQRSFRALGVDPLGEP